MLELKGHSFQGPHFWGLALIDDAPGVVALVDIGNGATRVLRSSPVDNLREAVLGMASRVSAPAPGVLRGLATLPVHNPIERQAIATELLTPRSETPPRSWKRGPRPLSESEYRRRRRY